MNLDSERKRDVFDSSVALSDHVSSLDINVVGRIIIGRCSVGDLVHRFCWGISDYCLETDVTWQS